MGVENVHVREGRGVPMVLLAVFAMRCRIFRQEAVQPPYHASDAASEDVLNGAQHLGGWDLCSPQVEVGGSLSLIGQQCGVVGPGEVLRDVDPQDLAAAHYIPLPF